MSRFCTYFIALLLFVPAFASSDDLSPEDNFLSLEVLPTIDSHKIPVQISLNNKQDITACEFCITLPGNKNFFVKNTEGTGYEYEASSRLTESHSVSMKWGATGYSEMMFVSIVSPSTSSFEGIKGPLITFYIDGSNLDEGKYEIGLINSMVIWSDIYNTNSTLTPNASSSFTLENSKVYPGSEPSSCMITFKLDSQTLLSEKYPVGVLPVAPFVESKTGYTFSGWGELNTTNADTIYNASYIPNKYVVVYKVGEEVFRKDTLDYNTPIVPPEAPVKTGHTFTGWGDVASAITSDLTYTATYIPNKYMVVFIAGGDTIQSQLLDYGTAITAPDAPDVEGYTFNDWGAEVGTVPAQDVTFIAVYAANTYDVVYYVDDEVFAQDTYEFGENIVSPSEVPVKDGYKFIGWGEMAVTMPAHNLEYTAIFRRLGDVNLDDFVNAADVVSIYNYIISAEDSGIIKENADVNNDGVVNAADIVNVYNFIIYGDDNK